MARVMILKEAPTEPDDPTPPDDPTTHSITGLSIDADGWTDFEAVTSTGYEDARVVFVSTTGDDATAQIYGIGDVEFDTDGMFQPVGTPSAYATLAAANAAVREGYPDIILLKRGDEWTDEHFGSTNEIKSGRSQTERKIVASYGSGARPALHMDTGLTFYNYSESFIIISGIYTYANDWTISSRAIDVRGFGTDVLFEDVSVKDHAGGIVQGGDLYRIVFRRCIFDGGEAHDGQFYASGATDLVYEENLFHAPYDEDYPTGTPLGRFVYMSSGNSTTSDALHTIFRRNIFNKGEREAIDIRNGDIIHNNLSLEVDLMTIGGRGGSDDALSDVDATDNVFMRAPPNEGTANYIIARNIIGGSISRNIWTDPAGITAAANLISLEGGEFVHVLRDLTISENLMYGYAGTSQNRGITTAAEFTEVTGVVISDNEFQYVTGSDHLILIRDRGDGDPLVGFTFSGNVYWSTNPDEADWFSPGTSYDNWVSISGETGSSKEALTYTDPSRTILTYNQSLGGTASVDEWITRALAQARHNWDENYTAHKANDYIRAGFDRSAVAVTY